MRTFASKSGSPQFDSRPRQVGFRSGLTCICERPWSRGNLMVDLGKWTHYFIIDKSLQESGLIGVFYCCQLLLPLRSKVTLSNPRAYCYIKLLLIYAFLYCLYYITIYLKWTINLDESLGCNKPSRYMLSK